MSVNKPSGAEEEYFAREEAAKRQREALTRGQRMAHEEREQLKVLHFMKCPKCGFDLNETVFRGITIDKCYNCGGVWFDDKELDALAGEESNVFQSIVRLFKHKK